MKPLILPILAFAGVLACGATTTTAQPALNALSSIAQIRPGVKSKRVSSHDKAGGNGDCWNEIHDGQTRVIMDVKGAGIITHIWITMAPTPDKMCRNDIILKIYWDGNKEPSVLSPIGPFFGNGWDESYPFTSAPLATAPGAGGGGSLNSYFAMPFGSGARIEIENQSGKTINALYFNIDYVELPKPPEGMGRFHAWFNRKITDADPEIGENEWESLGHKFNKNPDGAKNFVAADIKGRGQFVGLNYYVHCPSPMWCGEGDEMIFIDGEAKSSINGTGTEDYYNMSWCPQEVHMHLYFGLARVNKNIGWLGRTHAYRFHIPDPIYFEKSLKFTIESGHGNVLTLDLATVAYWYMDAATGVPPIPDKDARKLMPMIDKMEIHRWRDAWRKQLGGGSKLWGNEKPDAGTGK